MIQVDRGMISHSEAAIMKGYAEKAIELDDDLAEAHASLAAAKQEQWDMTGAEKEVKRALELKPSYSTAEHWYFILLNSLGRYEEAFDHEKRALKLDPYSSSINQGIGIALVLLGRYGEASDAFERLMDMDPNFASGYYFGAWAHHLAGDQDTAVKLAEKAIEKAGAQYFYPKMTLANLYARSGRGELAARLLDEVRSDKSVRYMSPALLAQVKLDLGETQEGFRLLEQAYLEHDRALVYFRQFPWNAKHRSDPRWVEIERKMGY
jgi:serine/threonine-protein kinase